MKKFRFLMSLLVASSFFIAGCGGSSSTVADTDTPQTIAIDKLKAYAEDQTQPVPTVDDYVDAGIVGVTADNLGDINALVAGLTAEDVDTTEEIQAIFDEYELSILDPDDRVADATNQNTTVVADPLIVAVNAFTTITVTLADSNGDLLTIGGDAVTLTGSKANSTGSITGPIDNDNGTYTFTATQTVVKSDIRYIATVNGVEVINQSATVAFIEATVGEANATTSIVEATTPVVANGTAASTITVTLKDSAGISLITGGDAVALTSSSVTSIPSAVQDNNNGTYTFTATNTAIESVTYTATVNTVVVPDTAVVAFTDPAASDITNPATIVVAIPTEVVANDSNQTVITVTLVDGAGAPTDGGDAVTLTSSSTTSVPSVATDNSDGTYTFTASNTVAETVTYTAELNGVESTNSAIVEFVAGVADATQSTVTGSPAEVLNDGVATVTLTVTLADSNGNTITTENAYPVTMADNSDTAGISDVTANGDGTYTFEANNTVSETVIFTASVDGAVITTTASVLFTNNPASIVPADYVGNTVEFTGVDGEFSFYKNYKFVKVNSVTRDFEFIGTWDESGLYDENNVLINVVSVANQDTIYHYPMVDGKSTKGPEEVQGFALREKLDTRIEFIHFSDPAPDGSLYIWMYGYDSIALSSSDGHAKGTWEAVNGKIVATKDAAEYQTYAFDRGSVEGSIVTVTNDDNLLKVIVIGQFYELHPSTDLLAPIPADEIVAVDGTDFDGKMMTINSRTRGPASRYFEKRVVDDGTYPEDDVTDGYVDGIIWAVGISSLGEPWGGKGDHWNTASDNMSILIKVHYDGEAGTPEKLEFNQSPVGNGTTMTRWEESVRNNGDYSVDLGTSTLDQVSDF